MFFDVSCLPLKTKEQKQIQYRFAFFSADQVVDVTLASTNLFNLLTGFAANPVVGVALAVAGRRSINAGVAARPHVFSRRFAIVFSARLLKSVKIG